MPFLGIDDHGAILQKGLQKLRDGGRTIERLALDMSDAGVPVSRSHINAFLNANLNNKEKRWDHDKIATIYNFIETSPKYAGLLQITTRSSGRDDSYFFSSAYNYFDTPDNAKPSHLVSLVGQYAMFRPLWSSSVESHFIRTIVTIEQSRDAFLFIEKQNYEDPYFVNVDELSIGYIFLFGSIPFSVTNERDYKCRRFVCMHDFTSALNINPASVNKFYGEIKSISTQNIGPPAQKFVCRRIYDNNLDCQSLSASELLLEDQRYFEVESGKKRRKKS